VALAFVTANDALFELLDGLLVALAAAELAVVDVVVDVLLAPPVVAPPVPAVELLPGVVEFPDASGEGAAEGCGAGWPNDFTVPFPLKVKACVYLHHLSVPTRTK